MKNVDIFASFHLNWLVRWMYLPFQCSVHRLSVTVQVSSTNHIVTKGLESTFEPFWACTKLLSTQTFETNSRVVDDEN